jgi:hypothetical protein
MRLKPTFLSSWLCPSFEPVMKGVMIPAIDDSVTRATPVFIHIGNFSKIPFTIRADDILL